MQQHFLHVTDLHIADPRAESEHLREKFYKEYIDKLVKQVRQTITGSFSGIIATGDFVDKGNFANFAHASVVLEYLGGELGVEKRQIFACIGNHDFDRGLEKVGEHEKARQQYAAFASQFGNGSYSKMSPRGVLCQLNEKTWVLSLDGTRGCKGEDTPGNLSDGELDEVIGWIQEIPGSDHLLVASHYPVHMWVANDAGFDEEDPRWSERHLWTSGSVLKSRLLELKQPPSTVWLCGDIHKPASILQGKCSFVTTGRLGTRTGRGDGNVRRQVRTVSVETNGARARSTIFEFSPSGHRSQPQLGDWAVVSEKQFEIIERAGGDLELGEPALFVGQPGVAQTDDPSAMPGGTVGGSPETIDLQLEEEIVRTIVAEHLYYFGRFATSESHTSLSWIPIGPLMNSGQLLSSTITKMAKWVERAVRRTGQNTFTLIGIDCWGAVLASQLSLFSGSPHYCVAVRARGQHSVEAEGIGADVLASINASSGVIIVSDVVATGQSLRFIYDQVVAGIGHSAEEKVWLACSVLCDEAQDRGETLSFLDSHGTACKSLRMPLLPLGALPSAVVLPPSISFF